MAAISFSGLASGIDSEAIIKAMSEARRRAGIPLRTRVDDKGKENTALEELNTRLLSFKDAMSDFMTLSGRSALQKIGTTSDESILGVTASSNALSGTTTLSVQRLAKNASFSFADRFNAPTAKPFTGLQGDQTISVTVGSGDKAKSYSISVNANTTLADMASKLNSVSQDAISASIVNLGTESAPSYTLVMRTQSTGTQEGLLSVDVPAEITNLGVLQQQVLDQAADAVIHIDGLGDVTRSSNTISDVIPGVTLNLKQQSAGSVTIKVADDVDKTAEKLESTIGLLNEIIKYSRDNDTIERSENGSQVSLLYGTLSRTNVDNQAVQAIRAAISSTHHDGESPVRILADLGITTQRDGTLALSKEVLKGAVTKDPAAVSKLLNTLADKVSGAGGVIDTFTRYKGVIESAQDSNKEQLTRLNDRLDQLERSIAAQETTMKNVFAALETKMASLQQGASALSSLIGSVSRAK